MQILVLGAGAIGSLYGVRLAAANDVTLIGRPDHVRAINAHGLQVEGLQSTVLPIRATTAVEEIKPETLILLTTKVPAISAALEPLAGMVREDTTVLSLQNGLGSEELARAALCGRGVVLRGITQFGAIFTRPGAIKYMFAGYTLLESHERSARIAAVLNAAGLDCRISPDIAADVWRKLIYNCVVNPITTMLGCEVGGIADSRLDRLKQLIVDECLAVAAAEGHILADDFVPEINSFFKGSPNLASMLQDIQRARPTEIDYLNGAVVAHGAKHGLSCPVNRGLTSVIKAMEA